ncbi:MAG: S4 domain-containing protein [Gammaproteobacteria bacterium]
MSKKESEMRLDKWLWAARFFKTRSLAQTAVQGGTVHLNQQRVRPSRIIKPGDEVSITKGPYCFTVTVLSLQRQRGPASAAAAMYREHEDSVQARERIREERALQRSIKSGPDARPDKRERRRIVQFTRRRDS